MLYTIKIFSYLYSKISINHKYLYITEYKIHMYVEFMNKQVAFGFG